jgi:hypothetical protein
VGNRVEVRREECDVWEREWLADVRVTVGKVESATCLTTRSARKARYPLLMSQDTGCEGPARTRPAKDGSWVAKDPSCKGPASSPLRSHRLVPRGVVCGHLSLRCLFRRMCECMARPVDTSSSVDASLLVRIIVSGGESIYPRLLTRRRLLWGGGGPAARNRFRVCIVRMQAQIETIRGTDVVFHRLRSQIEDRNSSLSVSYTPTGLCWFECSVGWWSECCSWRFGSGSSAFL